MRNTVATLLTSDVVEFPDDVENSFINYVILLPACHSLAQENHRSGFNSDISVDYANNLI